MTSLDAIARTRGLRFGSAVGTLRGSFADAAYRSLVTAECGLIVPENELKWSVLRPSPHRFDFERADQLAGFARAKGLLLRGHTLLWNRAEFTPAWVNRYDFGARPAAATERLLTEHIARVAGRYADQIQSWDVVNETIEPATGAMRDTALGRALGPEIVEIAFHAARAGAPKARLVYNDYMGWGAKDAAHRAGVLRLLERLKTRGAPIDALGLQSHLGGGDPEDAARNASPDPRAWQVFLDEATGLGLDLLITEFDVHDRTLPADVAVRDAAVAGMARDYLDLTLSYRQVKQVLAWGMSDNHSWLQGRWPRADGLPNRPTPYDADGRAKPLREAMAAAFRAAPERTPWA